MEREREGSREKERDREGDSDTERGQYPGDRASVARVDHHREWRGPRIPVVLPAFRGVVFGVWCLVIPVPILAFGFGF